MNAIAQKAATAREDQINDLLKDLDRKSYSIRRIEPKIAANEPGAWQKPSLFQRLTKWLSQIAQLRQKEADILSRIDEVERRHRDMRLMKKVRLAAPVLDAQKGDPLFEAEQERKRKSRFWMWMILLYLLFRSSPKKRSILPILSNG